MQIHINDETLVVDIQEEFRRYYPYLKLEFFYKPHVKGEYYAKEEKVISDTPIEKIRVTHHSGWLDINYYRTAAAVEHDCWYLFGFCMQILRKSNGQWLETTGTDNWTLEGLNAAGRPAEKQTYHLSDEIELG
ncbi:hypothetical protein CLV51_10633 [Chitinophaga niastensis]|uniref:Uncharacterized protein n=1 Tax=Chitinophaga niastensis TaxID=536980 RepID=A0A2P8HD84_CHINA|nr:hypothetical protein [Chitinophaga niastensis]PSL44168.1 hypothetical protein CLV51_10633 [Chitinophaga niastensis]